MPEPLVTIRYSWGAKRDFPRCARGAAPIGPATPEPSSDSWERSPRRRWPFAAILIWRPRWLLYGVRDLARAV